MMFGAFLSSFLDIPGPVRPALVLPEVPVGEVEGKKLNKVRLGAT